MNLPFVYIVLLSKLPSMYVQNALFTIIVFHHTALVLTKKYSHRSAVVAHSQGIHWSYHVPHYPEASGMIEW